MVVATGVSSSEANQRPTGGSGAGERLSRQTPNFSPSGAAHGAAETGRRFFFQRLAVLGGPHAKALFHLIVMVSDGEASHGRSPVARN
jgi:hypothetical protein